MTKWTGKLKKIKSLYWNVALKTSKTQHLSWYIDIQNQDSI